MDIERLRTFELPPITQSYSARDLMLYALGLGIGHNPTDPAALRFVFEKRLQALPSYCLVVGSPGFWLQDPALAINWRHIVHGEQRFAIHRPLPPAGTVRAAFRILGVEDKGSGKGATLAFDKSLWDAASGDKRPLYHWSNAFRTVVISARVSPRAPVR
jgi:hypothetical protein